jgi:guanine deaminase
VINVRHIMIRISSDWEPDYKWMRRAIEIAYESAERGDHPFGALIVRNDRILAASGNKVVTYHDPTGHAEIVCIRKACLRQGNRHLPPGAVLYSTHAPCPMCLGAAVWAKVSGIVYGATQWDIHLSSIDGGRPWRWVDFEPEKMYSEMFMEANPNMFIIGQFMQDECRELLYVDNSLSPMGPSKLYSDHEG